MDVIGKWVSRAKGENNLCICFERGFRTGYAIVHKERIGKGIRYDILDPDGLSCDEVNMLIFMASKYSGKSHLFI